MTVVPLAKKRARWLYQETVFELSDNCKANRLHTHSLDSCGELTITNERERERRAASNYLALHNGTAALCLQVWPAVFVRRIPYSYAHEKEIYCGSDLFEVTMK